MAPSPESRSPRAITQQLLAIVLVAVGLYLAAFGNSWGPVVFELLSHLAIGAWIELIAPFLPMLLIGLGAVLLTTSQSASR